MFKRFYDQTVSYFNLSIASVRQSKLLNVYINKVYVLFSNVSYLI